MQIFSPNQWTELADPVAELGKRRKKLERRVAMKETEVCRCLRFKVSLVYRTSSRTAKLS